MNITKGEFVWGVFFITSNIMFLGDKTLGGTAMLVIALVALFILD